MALLAGVSWLGVVSPALARAAFRAKALLALCLLPILILGAPAQARAAHAQTSADPPVLAVVDIGLVDFAGPGSSQAEDEARSSAVTSAILSEVAEGGLIATISIGCKAGCSFDAAGVERLRRRAHAAGGTHVLVGNVRRIGSAVALMRVSVLDTATGHMLLDRMVSFRADSEAGWTYAASFLSREVAEALVAASP
ncbi:DUF2380 domain-containing protein [Ancylobacter sp. WKF20]|uniref:DUF2380 domain-containing protein n=1 Tax=Ancylobacter sp. WKF20 TaxID=3039801 RepID=UPI0024344F99|nr:DUF2380 domain-containing protein [Ancylobacter sp. WKF20]WGD31844.1 DUF2380 domain-containing protein [Ancylobacter sp. WKF20]